VHRQIFVNLPVKDLQRSVAFFSALGYTFNADFTNENATCMVLGENLFAMLLVEQFFSSFSKKPIPDPSKGIEVLVCLSCDSREQVDQLVAKARAAGGSVPNEAQDHGFMYAHGFADPDGHVWELVHMVDAGQAAPKD